MSIPFSQGKLQGEERKNVLQAVQEQAKAAARAVIKFSDCMLAGPGKVGGKPPMHSFLNSGISTLSEGYVIK